MFKIDQMNMPWIHSPFFERQLAAETTLADHEKEAVRFFANNGYLIFDPEIPAELLNRAVKETSEYEGPEKMWDGRIQQGWLVSKAIREVAVSRKVYDLLRMIYRREPIPFQTLNFSRGTEQGTHSDAIHFQSYPANFMCGVWVAFEDIGCRMVRFTTTSGAKTCRCTISSTRARTWMTATTATIPYISSSSVS